MLQTLYKSPISNFIRNPTRSVYVHIPCSNANKLASQLMKETSPYQSYDKLDDKIKSAATILYDTLPENIIHSIQATKYSDDGFLVISGIPEDPNLMQTPLSRNDMFNKKTFFAEIFSLGIAGLLKQELYNFRQEGWGTGDLIFNIFPKPEILAIKGAGGVTNDFRFHMEDAWHTQSPDTVLLKGLRADHDRKAVTYVVSNRKIFNSLTLKEREILKTHDYCILAPEIHKKMEIEKNIIFSENKPYVGPVVVENGSECKFIMNFNGMQAVDQKSEAQVVLDKVEKIAHQLTCHIKLDGGNLVIINNNRALHTRNGYEPKFDGQDRWFQRYFLLDSKRLWRNISLTEDHFPNFSQHEINDLFKQFKTQGILYKQKLTSKFQPHNPKFIIEIPIHLESRRKEITIILLNLAPSFPNRVV